MQFLQDPNQSNANNPNNVMKAKIDELETNSNNKNIGDLFRGISDFKKVYRPRSNTVTDEKVIWLQDPTVFWLGGGAISVSC